MSIAHISLPVGKHFIAMRDFYAAVLKPLGYEMIFGGGNTDAMCGMGTKATGPNFFLGLGQNSGTLTRYDGKMENRVAPIHLAFNATSTEQVDEWYANAMKFGAVDNGAPGIRTYSTSFYAAFVLDPLGNNIEVIYMLS
ncbi:Glyoxalase/Bleomycin resistance protein/Dihydroxybiphenyl dioxygenase [Aspergillus cavernicola]|uniref:Glyoxalase/Bleomycin resistance protein/Dihydroxybiphenyl dioxygenase n=1 Tax=Aspergillus cavernicola TaxID=176166 RepID=A0ABR4IHX2_9EURO